MLAREVDSLILPGLTNSDAGHWQRRWAQNLPNARVVEQDEWDAPRLCDWQHRLLAAVLDAQRPVVLIAHSLGCWLAMQSVGILPFSAAQTPEIGKIASLMLVAPPSRDAILALPQVDDAFVAPCGLIDAPMPNNHLPCPALLIASVDDPYIRYADSAALAAEFGAELVNAGAAGHINVASGHGPWPDGLMQLGRLLKKIGA